jgi:hypothetical protein
MLSKAKEIPIFSRFKQLGRNYMSRCYMSSNHPSVQLLEELSILVNNPGRGENEKPLISEYYKKVTPLGPLIQSRNCPLAFNYTYESLFYRARVSFNEGRQIKEAQNHNEELKKKYTKKMRTSKCFTLDNTNMENKSFVGSTLIDISDGISWKFRIAKIASTFTVEALAIGKTLEIIAKIDLEQNFSDSKCMLQGISNTSTMNNTSHIILMLKTK